MRFSEPDMSVVVAIVASRELGRSATDQLNLLQVNICQTIKTMKLYLLVTVLISSIVIVGCAKSKPVFEKSGVVQAMMSYGGPGNLSLFSGIRIHKIRKNYYMNNKTKGHPERHPLQTR